MGDLEIMDSKGVHKRMRMKLKGFNCLLKRESRQLKVSVTK
jgi:hypothetical protein